MDIELYLQKTIDWLLSSGLRVLLILILTFVAIKVGRIISAKLFSEISKRKEEDEFRKRADTLSSMIRYALTIAIAAVAIIMILGELGIEIGPILAAAGILGLAVGFGAQNLVQDVISGFFILLENQIRVNDVVEIAGKKGLVEKINLRMTILRDLSGNVHYVRNGKIDVVTNYTKDFSRYLFDIGVAYRENVDEVIEVIKEVDEEMRNDPQYQKDILEPIDIMGLDQFADSAVVIRARNKTMPGKQWAIGREFKRRLKQKFDEKDIEIPFPHLTLYPGKDKQGQSPALNLELTEDRLTKAIDNKK